VLLYVLNIIIIIINNNKHTALKQQQAQLDSKRDKLKAFRSSILINPSSVHSLSFIHTSSS